VTRGRRAAVCSLIVGSSATPSAVLRLHSTNAAPKRTVSGVGVGHAHTANQVLGCVDVDGVRQVFRRRGASGLAWSSMIPRCAPHACDLVRVSRHICCRASREAPTQDNPYGLSRSQPTRAGRTRGSRSQENVCEEGGGKRSSPLGAVNI
jgi:hypothetical protein